MFYLKKCAKCERYGRVAMKENDKVCNLCKGQNAERDEKGHFKGKE